MSLATALLCKALGLPKQTTKAVITLEAGCPVVDVTMLIPALSTDQLTELQEVQRRFVLVERSADHDSAAPARQAGEPR